MVKTKSEVNTVYYAEKIIPLKQKRLLRNCFYTDSE